MIVLPETTDTAARRRAARSRSSTRIGLRRRLFNTAFVVLSGKDSDSPLI
jgi:hypothetical protein